MSQSLSVAHALSHDAKQMPLLKGPPLCVPECEVPGLPPFEPDPAHPWNQPSAAATASATTMTLPFFMRPLPRSFKRANSARTSWPRLTELLG